ncbi:hypothetical protein B0H19DRAFT_1385088 [Mycena capillaripes]|nr:hypothetical protein B0H19DRAFT_1385088 [Mycena capillaripes]
MSLPISHLSRIANSAPSTDPSCSISCLQYSRLSQSTPGSANFTVSQESELPFGSAPKNSLSRGNAWLSRADAGPDALPLLAVLSMLPAGTLGKNLKWWALGLSSAAAAVDTLRTTALIEQDDQPFATSRIFVRPTIQVYMARQSLISPDVREQVQFTCYRFVLDHKSGPDDPSFKADVQALANEETNIQGLLMQITAQNIRPNALDALIAFSLYQSWTKPSTVVAAHALEVAKAICDDSQVAHPAAAARQVAEAHRCLGRTLLRLDRYEEACERFEEARHCFRTLPDEADLHSAGGCAMELVETWMYLPEKSGHQSVVEEAHADLAHDPTQEYYVARGLLGFGHYLWSTFRENEALQKLSAAKTILAKLNCPSSSTECLYHMARCYAVLDQYPAALQAAREAWEKVQESGELDLTWCIAVIMARCLISLGRYEEAIVILQQVIPASQALGRPLAIGQILEPLGYCSAAKMDVAGAIPCYKAAQVQFAKIKSTFGEYNAERCAGNIKRFEGMTEMDDAGFLALEKPPLA